MTYYIYRQNNSGGSFIAPAINIVVKADSPEQAETIALANGMYFDPEFEQDCECCGERWYGSPDVSDTVPVPSEWDTKWANADDVPVQLVIE
jgi:hypothetical protein